jgi:hypothetical protein
LVAGSAFLATAIATVFWEAMLVRYTQRRRPHEGAWTAALAMFVAASAALAVGASTTWDGRTFRVFYLFGAVLNVPWRALGTLYLLAPAKVARTARSVLLVFSGFAAGVVFTARIHGTIPPTGIPSGHDHFPALPRVLAAVGSGLGATVVIVGAVWSAGRLLTHRPRPSGATSATSASGVGGADAQVPGARRLAGANGAIALGTLVLSAGGLAQGLVGEDEGFVLTLVVGIAVIYAGFRLATQPAGSRSASSLPALDHAAQ